MTNKDFFAHRNMGGRFEIGSNEDSGIRGFIEIDEKMHILTNKNLYELRLPDTADPNRTNSSLPATQQKILPYGSEDEILGRTLQQAVALFEPGSLPNHIDIKSAINISMLFLKGIITTQGLKDQYQDSETEANKLFDGKLKSDHSLHVPSISDVEQKVKSFISSTSQSHKHLMELAQLFYPNIPNEKWNIELLKRVTEDFSKSHPCVIFIESITSWLWLIRELRNEIEHPSAIKRLHIKNYELKTTNEISSPTISFDHKSVSMEEVTIADFMSACVENSLLCFELLTAHLCNAHAVDFAGDKRTVIEVPNNKRADNMPHVRFVYEILWTK